jgi:hypothetical protein
VTLSRLSTISRPPNQPLLVRVDFKKPHPQLLLMGGSADNSIPASLNKSHHAKYKLSPSVTDFKEFAGRTHFIVGQKNREEVADYPLAWLNEKGVWPYSDHKAANNGMQATALRFATRRA